MLNFNSVNWANGWLETLESWAAFRAKYRIFNGVEL